MDIKVIENYWVQASTDDFETVIVLMEKKRYMHAMFFLHLSIEKQLKGLYVNQNNCEAPFGHNLPHIAERISAIAFDRNTMKLLAQITTFNIATRYDDYKRSFYQRCSREFANEYYKKGEKLL